MLDLVITGGKVVTPNGVGVWDVAVEGERIVAVAVPGTLTADVAKTIDATGKIVVPGGVEAHTHVLTPLTPSAWGSDSAGPAETSKAAIWGGTTTFVDFATVTRAGDAVSAAQEHLGFFEGKSYADYSAHCTYFGPGASTERVGQIKDLIAAGLPSIKVFTTNHAPRPNRPVTMIDAGQLRDIMQQTAAHGGIVAVHAEDDEVVQRNYALADERGEHDWYHLPVIRSNLSEELSVRRTIQIARHTGSAMYIVHTSAREGVDAVAHARSHGLPVFAETILLYCSFNSENYHEHDGMKYHTYPSTKSETDRLRLWDGLLCGDVSILATDSIATSYEQKTRGRTTRNVQGGNIGIEIRMGVAYTEGVVKQGMSLERFVAITSTNPARILGFYPRKGAIAPGSDADITIMDPSVRRRLSASDLHLRDYLPWEGWEVAAWPTTTILRGKVMVEDGVFTGEPTDGQLIPRKIDPSVLNGPVV